MDSDHDSNSIQVLDQEHKPPEITPPPKLPPAPPRKALLFIAWFCSFSL